MNIFDKIKTLKVIEKFVRNKNFIILISIESVQGELKIIKIIFHLEILFLLLTNYDLFWKYIHMQIIGFSNISSENCIKVIISTTPLNIY